MPPGMGHYARGNAYRHCNAAGEFHTWTDDEIAVFETVWPLGSKERCAFALLLYREV